MMQSVFQMLDIISAFGLFNMVYPENFEPTWADRDWFLA